MGHKRVWASVLGVVAVVLAGFWAVPRVFPELGWGLNELNQIAGIASLAVTVATLVVAAWPKRPVVDGGEAGNDDEGSGDSIDLSRVKAEGSVMAKTGPQTGRGRDRIRMRGIRAGKDVIGKQTTPPRKRPRR
ncbi:hypothetical protein [Nocardiopsis sp. MG754419]|uniref:hypothetical protein n=1 Tax=Nocardiopsis sp. MG754419 TaxID=2259865 RepID=UPI001BAB818D|nr:hypothetical protein [Nocardiopsis sp. MG754419]MBR8743708.1 hypothetical protein [Nocardiopsis sp. MG754419]